MKKEAGQKIWKNCYRQHLWLQQDRWIWRTYELPGRNPLPRWKKLKCYLDIYDIQGLYQRKGYLLDRYWKKIQISKELIGYCKSKIGKSRCYLVNEAKGNSFYNGEWNWWARKIIWNNKSGKWHTCLIITLFI